MTDDRKIITYEQWLNNKVMWNELPDAPKHTDEEYDKLFWESEAMSTKLAYSVHVEDYQRLEARIKELEAELSKHGACNFLRGPQKEAKQ